MQIRPGNIIGYDQRFGRINNKCDPLKKKKTKGSRNWVLKLIRGGIRIKDLIAYWAVDYEIVNCTVCSFYGYIPHLDPT